jgi:hypothetical protein
MTEDQERLKRVYEDLERRFELQATKIISGGEISGGELQTAANLATTLKYLRKLLGRKD